MTATPATHPDPQRMKVARNLTIQELHALSSILYIKTALMSQADVRPDVRHVVAHILAPLPDASKQKLLNIFLNINFHFGVGAEIQGFELTLDYTPLKEVGN